MDSNPDLFCVVCVVAVVVDVFEGHIDSEIAAELDSVDVLAIDLGSERGEDGLDDRCEGGVADREHDHGVGVGVAAHNVVDVEFQISGWVVCLY